MLESGFQQIIRKGLHIIHTDRIKEKMVVLFDSFNIIINLNKSFKT